MRKPRFIHSPATGSSALAAPRSSRPIRIRCLPRLPYPSCSTRLPSTHSVTFQDPPPPTNRHPAFDRSLVNLDVVSTLVSPGYLPFDQTQQRTTQVRLGPIVGTRSSIALFRFRARAELPAATARTFIASVFASIALLAGTLCPRNTDRAVSCGLHELFFINFLSEFYRRFDIIRAPWRGRRP